MLLITSFYIPENKERYEELKQALQNNFLNQYIKKIYLLNDKIYDLSFIEGNEQKIIQVIVDDENKSRLGFDYSIKYINDNFTDNICILANSDIYFDKTLSYLINYNFDNKVLALSRYDNGIRYSKRDSQDSWIFKSKANINLDLCNFKFGLPGCDNRLAYIFFESGYEVINPSKTIKSHHLHNSNFKTYNLSSRVPGPYHLICPTELF